MALTWKGLTNRFATDSDPHPRPPAHIRRLQPYSPVSSLDQITQAGDTHTQYKLDWNEATVEPSPRVKEALLALLDGASTLRWYPDLRAGDLRSALERHTGVTKDSIIVTNGSDDALLLLCRTFLSSQNEVVVPVPTYNHFMVYAGAQNARIVEVAEPDPFRKNIRHLKRSITSLTRMVYLVSPNNPTGVVWEEKEVAALCTRFPRVLFVVDEAYHEFSGQSVIQLTQKYSNLAVTRTFSKAYGLAAFRIGYVAAHPQLCDHLLRLHNPKSVNTMAQVAATAALSDTEHLKKYVDDVCAARADFVDFLRGRGLEARETPGNYVLVRVPDPDAFIRGLEERGVYVRDRSRQPRMSGFVRISVGTAEQMKDVQERITEVMDSVGW